MSEQDRRCWCGHNQDDHGLDPPHICAGEVKVPSPRYWAPCECAHFHDAQEPR